MDIALSDDDAEPSFGIEEDRAAYDEFEHTGRGIPGGAIRAALAYAAKNFDHPIVTP